MASTSPAAKGRIDKPEGHGSWPEVTALALSIAAAP
jgi:hypothetical protein